MKVLVHAAVCACALAGCAGNDLPPPGSCEVDPGGGEVEVTTVPLGEAAYFDDLAFAPELGRVVAAPAGTGSVYLVEPDDLDVIELAVPDAVESADASATTVYAADRSADAIVAVDVGSGEVIATRDVAGTPDYVRVAPTTGQVWITIPLRNRLEILEATTLSPAGSVTLPGPPEGLTFDAVGRAYVNVTGGVVAVDVADRVVVAEWDVGCGGSHGFPQSDPTYDLAFGGCRDEGGVGVTTGNGDLRAGFEAGGGVAVLAYDAVRHHLYLRSDPGDSLEILAVCPDGELGPLASVPIPERGHASVADASGNVWVADATTGGLVKIVDPFPGT